MTDGKKTKIISGGQTGADQAALDAAISLGLQYGGWLPKGRKTEKGPLDVKYRLQELPTGEYRVRTEKNVVSSDATLIFSHGPLTGGSALTEALAIRHDRPCLHIDLNLVEPVKAVAAIEQWMHNYRIKILNIAGPRASGDPAIYNAVYSLLCMVCWP